MPKVLGATITVSFQAMNFEPLLAALLVQAKLSTDDWMDTGVAEAIGNHQARKRAKEVDALGQPIFKRYLNQKEVEDEEKKTAPMWRLENDFLEKGETRVAVPDDAWMAGGQASITVPQVGRKY